MSSLFGWGGVYITGDSEPATFATSFGNVSYEKVDVRNTTIDGKIIVHPKGWRAVIECELFNTSAADVLAFQRLAALVSISQETSTPLTVYPRYTATDAGSVRAYTCFIDSEFAPRDIANVDIGQTINLRFVAQELITYLPTNYSGQTVLPFIDESDNQYVDENADSYQLF
jgi:hypothetical protein